MAAASRRAVAAETARTTKAVAKKTSAKAAAKPGAKAPVKTPASPARAARGRAPERAAVEAAAAGQAAVGANELKVRMYRVGFGDFFLLTIPTDAGPKYILIDCGVHMSDTGSIRQCVENLAKDTHSELALVIVTHRHADHISGFATCQDLFKQFKVEAVWITNRLAPPGQSAPRRQEQIVALAEHLKSKLTARLKTQLALDLETRSRQALEMVNNALGVVDGGNARAMEVVTSLFGEPRPVPQYYQAGDVPKLPKSLEGAIDAQILGPAPLDQAGEFSAADNKANQYLDAVDKFGMPDDGVFRPFSKRWEATAHEYLEQSFKPWTPAAMERTLQKLQPDALLAAASTLDGTLNNQSLVVLFTCRGKRLLFVGDAQWGNWAYWLYGKPVKGQDPGISAQARSILESIDFYKVGHHGSTNATPIPVVNALRMQCAGMCSTATTKCYPEVPKLSLLTALSKRAQGRLVRSDWLPVGTTPANEDARKGMEKLPEGFEEKKDLYIEYSFPT